MGTMMPSSAAALAPRSEVSSQGWTTTVVAGGTSLASEISFSYLLGGGCPNGPPVVMAPISLSWNMLISPLVLVSRLTRSSGCFRLKPPDLQKGNSGVFLCDPEEPANLAQPLLVLRRSLSASSHDLLDGIEGFAPRLSVGRKQRGKGRKCALLIDQQHRELLAHQCLEFRQRHISVTITKTTYGLESSFVDGTSFQAYVDERANNGFAQSAGRDLRLELGDPFLQQLIMKRVFGGPSERPCVGGIDTGCSLQRRRAVDGQESPFRSSRNRSLRPTQAADGARSF
jgi:hypothetical protein